jgi:putative membrane protein
MNLEQLPALNATLNGLCTVFLLLGYRFIRKGDKRRHRNCMIAALITSALFLKSYLTYHFYVRNVLHRGPTRFVDPEWFRPFYLALLASHTILAAVIVPLVLVTLVRAVRERFELHRKIARWTWPLWMYVSVTGVLIYLLLYQIFPQK